MINFEEFMITQCLTSPVENRSGRCGSSDESCSFDAIEWCDTGQGESGNENGEFDLLDEESFLEGTMAHDVVLHESVRKCYNGGSDDMSPCESHCTQPPFEEDNHLSQDEDDPLMAQSSDDTDADDDSDIFDVLFGSQGDPMEEQLCHYSEKQSLHSSQINKSKSREEHSIPIAQLGGIRSEAECDGIRLVHLLIAAAEAVASQTIELAEVIFRRLTELVCREGTTVERVAAYFCDALKCRIQGNRSGESVAKVPASSRDQFLATFQILQEFTPFIKFGYLTANQAIFEAIERESRVHILDYDIMEGVQWASLMESLVARKGGAPHLRITALSRSHSKETGVASVQETGRRLSEFAASLNLSFTFAQVRLEKEQRFRPSSLKISKGEALVGNCMVNLPLMPRRTAISVSSFISGMQTLGPKIVTLVEEQLGYGTQAFTSDFCQALHYYSAIFDCLDATFCSDQSARKHVEKIFLAPRITSTLASRDKAHSVGMEDAFGGRENPSALMASTGFSPVPVSSHNRSQARLLLGLFEERFQIVNAAEDQGNYLRLGWHSNPLFAASVWKCS